MSWSELSARLWDEREAEWEFSGSSVGVLTPLYSHFRSLSSRKLVLSLLQLIPPTPTHFSLSMTCLSPDDHLEAIKRREYARRELRLQRRVRVVVRQVGEERALRADPTRRLDRLVKAEVRRVRLVEERVEHQHAHASQQLDRGGRDRLGVRDVPDRANAVPKNPND